MARLNRQCMTCNSKYSYCPQCSKVDALKAPWHSTFCCEDCRTIWKTLTKFSMGILPKTEAKEILSKIELKPIETYAECVQRGLKNVMAEDEVVAITDSAIDTVEQSSMEVEQEQFEIMTFSEEVVEQPVVEAEQPVTQPKYYSKKNKRKSHVVVQEEI